MRRLGWNIPMHILATVLTLSLKCTDYILASIFLQFRQNILCHNTFGFIANQVIVLKAPGWLLVKFLNNSFSRLLNVTQWVFFFFLTMTFNLLVQ